MRRILEGMAKEIVRRSGGALEGPRSGGGAKLEKKRSSGAPKEVAKRAPKKAAKHPAKKAAKKAAKHAAKGAGKQAAKKAAGTAMERFDRAMDRDDLLAAAYHHLSRAAAVISLLEQESGGDLRMLLDRGVSRFEEATGRGGKKATKGAYCLLRAAEHLGLAGLYAAREEHGRRVVQVSNSEVEETLPTLLRRFDGIDDGRERDFERLRAMGAELARRAEGADHDLHLVYELTMAAHWICSALEADLL